MMIFNLCLLTTVYLVMNVSGSIRNTLKFDIKEVCENLKTLYELLYPVVDLKLELNFGTTSPHLYLYGKGAVVFSPYMIIDHCTRNKRKKTTVINVMVNDILTVQFQKRPWVVIEDCEIQIYVSRTFAHKEKEMVIKILSISVAQFRRASANCGKDLVRPEEVKIILNAALAKCSLVGMIFHANNKISPKSALNHLLQSVFKYYMSKLVIDNSTDIEALISI